MNRLILFLKTQPSAIVNILAAILGFAVAMQWLGFSEVQTGAVLGAVSAVLGFIVGLTVRPFQWSFVTGLVQAGVMLAAEFGASLSVEATGQLYTLVSLIGGVVMWILSTPEVKFDAPVELNPHPRRRAPLIE